MGQGVGSALLDHAVDRARRAGFDRLTLDCFEKNEKALAFYRARGFTVVRAYVADNYLAGEPVRSLALAL
jgi:ribosomal protein S18 acetylase RimI-like enzyme